MHNNYEILIAMYNRAQSLEKISDVKAFQAYDQLLDFIVENDLQLDDFTRECNYRYVLLYGKIITKYEIEKDLRRKIHLFKNKDNPAAVAALCRIYSIIIANAFFDGRLQNKATECDIKSASLLLKNLQIETEDSMNLRRLLEEIYC